MIYYFHIVVSIVRFTGSVGRFSVKQNLHNSIQTSREIKVPIGSGALQYPKISITIQLGYLIIFIYRITKTVTTLCTGGNVTQYNVFF